MSDATAGAAREHTLWDALKDVGWFPALYSMAVGGPSLLAILELVLDGFRLVPAVQWIVDGYHQLTRVLGLLIEPLLAPVVAWINGLLGWKLVLHPHWRPLLLLGIVYVMPYVRAAWRERSLREVVRGILVGLAVVISALIVGLMPLTAVWWTQGLIAALMVALMIAGAVIAKVVAFKEKFGSDDLGVIVFWSTIAFGVAAGAAYLFSSIDRGAGILVWAGFIGVLGIVALAGDHISDLRRGLTMIGGFVVAALILVADAVVKWLS